VSDPEAKFDVGDVVHHLKFDYRGVIVDVDASFAGDDAWYEQMALSRPPREYPWYRVLVDGADHMTYVAERHLGLDLSGDPNRHPHLDQFFEAFSAGRYRPRTPFH
jgi:heat shock protein HspQ